ncbi:uncharacterized protein LOC62_05G007151 [Vanrija pseudolonga]|uniref:Mid2 domain-containing protein n=1 Tax=Vanrija pseudolonga TaxID=143232 RepID=A0AAF0YEZ4_9TREE|nr:hypothetical protein LOC62_05G007151 [Vanrija pseudolonga]
MLTAIRVLVAVAAATAAGAHPLVARESEAEAETQTHSWGKRDTKVFGQPIWVLVLIIVGAVVGLSIIGLIIKHFTGRNPFASSRRTGGGSSYPATHNYYDNSAQHNHMIHQQHEWDRQQRQQNEWHEQNYGYQAQQNQHHY